MGEFRGFNPTIPDVLPHEKMYNLQIGDKLFVLSGASLSSDAPSYFTNYFLERTEDKPLFIDRSPQSFQYIYNHLQGYHSEIPNGDIFTKVYSDSIYYNLPRLKELLSKDEYYYVEVMNECIKVPKVVLRSEGNFPNFFNITFEALYRDLSELMISRKLIRPPPQAAPQLNRDAGLLKDLIKLLQGVELEMTNDYKKVLRKEARYYRFNALVEKLSYVKIIKNPIILEESIIVNYNDVAYKNFTIVDIDTNDGEPILKRPRLDHVSDNQHYTRTIKYERRYLDKGESRGLIVEIDTPEIIADLDQEISSNSANNLIKKIHLSTKITSLLSRCFNHFNNITGYEFGNQSIFNIYQGQIILDNIKLEHQQDCQGNLRFNDVDFSFNDKKSSLSLDSFNDYEQLLFKKSYWKLDIGINDGEQKFYVNFTPVKVEAVANTKASMYSCLI